MSPINEFLQGYFVGMTEAVRVIKANATLIGKECGMASLYGIVLVACLVAVLGIWKAGCGIGGMMKKGPGTRV